MILSSKKIKELEAENEDLRSTIQSLSAQQEQLKRFDELLKKARIEYAGLMKRKDETAQSLSMLENEKSKLSKDIQKISSEINQLRELKLSEENQLFTLGNALRESSTISNGEKILHLSNKKLSLYKEIDEAEERKNKIKNETLELQKQYQEINQKILRGKKLNQSLLVEIEKKKEEISNLQENHNKILREQQENFVKRVNELNYEEKKISEGTQSRIRELSEEETNLISRIADQKELLEELDKKNEERNAFLQKVPEELESTPQIDGDETNPATEIFSSEETEKKELISEIDDKIITKKSQLESLKQDYKVKTSLLNEVSAKNEELQNEIDLKTKKLTELDAYVEITTVQLSDLNTSLDTLEDELSTLNKDLSDKESLKYEIEEQLYHKKSNKEELEEYVSELKETVAILAQLKHDIEKGSGLSAKRFTSIIQNYSSLITEMHKKKIQLEKMIKGKEKDIGDRDKLIEEKQSALDEIENKLHIRQSKIQLFKDLINTIEKQRDILINQATGSEDTGFQQDKIKRQQLIISNLSSEKLLEFENALSELLIESDRGFIEKDKKRVTVTEEISDPDLRVKSLNKQIRDSEDELSELKSSLSRIKEEHEEHRQDINKLASLRKKLEEEIGKQKIIIDKFLEIKEKIRAEQESIRNRRGQKEVKEFIATQGKNK